MSFHLKNPLILKFVRASHKQRNEPIRTRSKYMSLAPSAGKRVRASHNSFLLLIELRKWREFCQPITELSKVKPKPMRICKMALDALHVVSYKKLSFISFVSLSN